ncbi:MAG: NAD(P)-binding protein [Candidatus Helarchaeota archaeon]
MPKRKLEFVNLREQVSFVHMKDREDALLKAKELIEGAVNRSTLLESVPRKTVNIKPVCAVIGGGIGGMTSALDLANAGFKVYLIDKYATIGGNMAKLDRIFPTDECCI